MVISSIIYILYTYVLIISYDHTNSSLEYLLSIKLHTISENEAPMTSGMPSRHRGSPAPILDCVLSAVQLRLATDHIWPQVGRDGSIFFAESWDRQLLIGSVCVEKNIFICVFYVIISVYINQIMGTLYTLYIYIYIYYVVIDLNIMLSGFSIFLMYTI